MGAEGSTDDLKVEGEKVNKRSENEKALKDKIKKIDSFLKEKLANIYTSVKKAFLDLDMDRDGYISVEDIMKYFGTQTELSIVDLKKILSDRSSHPSKLPLISYQDFSRWVGNSIHSV